MQKEFPANPLEKPGYPLEFHDEFDGTSVDESKWIPYHLPRWTSSRKVAAKDGFEGGHLVLRIEEDQEPWCPEYDGEIRVSSLQTSVFSGPLGSTQGQHRFNRESVVREVQRNRVTYTPTYGYFETRLKGVKTPGNRVALWMIGFEDVPENSSEICICEIFGKRAGAQASKIGMGVHPFGDHRIVDDFREVELPFDISDVSPLFRRLDTDAHQLLHRHPVDQGGAPVPQLPDAIHARHLRKTEGDCAPGCRRTLVLSNKLRGRLCPGIPAAQRLPLPTAGSD